MDILGLVKALVEFFQANWSVIEPLARRLAEDLAALWVLGLALAEILKKFLPQSTAGASLKAKMLTPFNR